MSTVLGAGGLNQLQLDLQKLFSTHCQGANEVEMVANTFRKQAAVADWIAALTAHVGPSRQVGYTSVFCHQRPYVTFQKSGATCKCELGDVLLVISDHKSRLRRAILLQAKHSASMQHNPNDCQWWLYHAWPKIEYSVGGGKESRQINDPGYRNRGQYLLLTAGGPLQVCIADQTETPNAFETEFEKMIDRWPSVPISWNQAKPEHTEWSHMIWDLLMVTRMQRMPSYGKSVPIAATRGTTMYLARSQSLGNPEAFEYMMPVEPGGEDEIVREGGFTFVLVELFEETDPVEEEASKDE